MEMEGEIGVEARVPGSPNPVTPEQGNQPQVETVLSDTSPVESNASSYDLWINAPPYYEYIALLEWFKLNFAEYFSDDFETYLTNVLGIRTLAELGSFLDNLF